MRIAVLAIGRARNELTTRIFDDYMARLPWPYKLRELQESRPLNVEKRKQREAELLLGAVPERALAIALDGGGKMLSSEEFARRIGAWRDDGVPCVAFLIGGADGHGAAVLKRADLTLSLGPMVWPHLLVRAMLAEQLWRAASILSGHPYHRA
ncbi:MAG: 23S rRNA (pseudouridine(1915)-N(3))-methyltransferase RlmH [Alphaproteobacteria bacterium]